MSTYLIKTNYCLQCEDDAKKIAELERKLAEQQASLVTHRECMEHMLDICINIHKVDFPQAQKLLAKDIPTEELNNLLAKAKEEGWKEAMPEGWQFVPKEPTPEMYEAFKFKYVVGDYWKERLQGALDAMLAAAPKPRGE